jgi:hypothetical protein
MEEENISIYREIVGEDEGKVTNFGQFSLVVRRFCE